MMEPLTREQVIEHGEDMVLSDSYIHRQSVWHILLAHDAALRAQVQAWEQECISWRKVLADERAYAQRQLAAMTKEKDRQLKAKDAFMEAVESMREERTGLQRQLSKAQQEVVRLRELIRSGDCCSTLCSLGGAELR